jgi:hypothetical protein
MAATSEAEDLEAEGLIAYSYTNFFKIKKRMRRIQDIVIPLREGISVEQFLTFFGTLAVMGILYGMFVAPIVNIFGIDLGWQFFLFWYPLPAVLASQRISKPMPNSKTISGALGSWMRNKLDDPIHRRGVPLPGRPRGGKVMHFQREFTLHPQFAGDALIPVHGAASDDGLTYTGQTLDLEDWMASRSGENLERHQMEKQASRQVEKDEARNFLLVPRAHVVVDDDE